MFDIAVTRTAPRILDFDVETVAAGFADPNWVPQKITCIAWSWVGEDRVYSVTRLGVGGIRSMLEAFLFEYERAEMVTGHNLLRFDLPIIQSELLRHGYPSLGPKLVQDTMRLVKTKGFKKGQDNIGSLLRTPIQKMPLNWQEWQDAYDEPDWKTVVERCESDVVMHKMMRAEMLNRGWVKPPTMWRP